MAISRNQLSATSGALFSLLHPRGQARLFAGALVVGLLAGWLSVTQRMIISSSDTEQA